MAVVAAHDSVSSTDRSVNLGAVLDAVERWQCGDTSQDGLGRCRPLALLPFAPCKHTRRPTGTSDRMPAPSKRPSPPARMVELLSARKVELLTAGRALTMDDFRRAWEDCWEVIVLEHGWAHATRLRRSMRQVQDETREECCAAFLNLPTPFAAAAARMDEIATSAGVTLAPAQLGRALLASIVLVELPEGDDRADAAALAAREFMGIQDRPREIAA